MRRDLIDLVDGKMRATAEGDRTLRATAASRIWRAFEALRAVAALAPDSEQEAMHAVRIDAKRLRYALEFLGDALPPSRTVLIERLVALQDHLGAINDAATASRAAGGVLLDDAVDLTPVQRASIARYAADRDREIARLRRGVASAWEPIASPAFARRLGVTVVIG
jgi:adenylate cyclase